MHLNRRMDKENVVYIHNGVLLSHKKNEMMTFASKWIEMETVMLSEVRPRKLKVRCFL